MEELERLFKRLYEDNISGKINDSRFEKLSANYENEQAELAEKTARLTELDILLHIGDQESTDRLAG